MDGNTSAHISSSNFQDRSRFRLLVVVLGGIVFLVCVLVFLFFTVKLHIHIPLGQKNARTSYYTVCLNQSAVDLFTFAQAHDKAGEIDQATEDYQACVKSKGFRTVPDKVKPVILELLDCRYTMDPHDYFDEMICHSRISYWNKEQMPLKVYVPDQSHADGFNDYDRKEIASCFDEWCAIIPDRVSYKIVDSPEHAEIVFSQKAYPLDLSYSRTVLAHTIPVTAGPEKWSVFPSSKATIEPLKFYPEIKDSSDSRAAVRHMVFLHEIGHSLGIIGHSCNADDLMFFSGAPKMSERDKNTFRRIYADDDIYKRAEASMRKSAENNDKYALVQLAGELDKSGTASPQELKKVFQLAKRAADLGSNRAVLMLGWMYHDGNGVKRDLQEAAKYFHMACARGNPGALLALANLYERGDGEPQNINNSDKYYKMALKMDLARAPIAYGNFLSYHCADKKSLERAVSYYKLSAGKNQMEADTRLALLYLHGEGVKKDPLEASNLRKKAEQQILRLKAKDGQEYFARGCAWSEICESQRAIDDFTKAIALIPNCRAAYLGRGAAYQALGKNTEACSDLSKALELDSDCIPAYLGRAYSELGMGKAATALKDVNSLLARTKSPDSDRLYGLMVGALASRMLKDENSAKQMLDQAANVSSEKNWPGPIVRFLRHDISDAEFLREANGYSRSTEVRFYMAMDQSLRGKVEDAMDNFRWVAENGDRTFYEYPVAIAMLDNLQKSPRR